MLTATNTFSGMQLDAQPTPAILDRNKVVEQYAHLIKKVAYKMIARLPANVEMDDLMSAGVIGLIDAAEKYDPEKSCNFKSYAEIRIRGAMVDELRSLDWVPRSVRQKGASIDVVARELQGKLGRPATELEIATEMGLTLEEFQDLTDKARAVSVVSFEDLGVGGSEDKRDFLDSVGDPEASDPAQSTEQNDERDVMMRAIQALPERQRVVLTLYYFEDMNLKEIGSLLGVTESRISQIHSAAVAQLRPILEGVGDIRRLVRQRGVLQACLNDVEPDAFCQGYCADLDACRLGEGSVEDCVTACQGRTEEADFLADAACRV